MPRELIALLLRHGETELNAEDCFRGMSNPPLDDEGVKQAERAATFLKGTPIKRIVSSPLLRAYQTAHIVGDAIGMGEQIEQTGGMFPLNVGFMAGRPKEDYNPILEFYVNNPKLVIPDGESIDMFETRMQQFYTNKLKEAENIGLTLFIGHTSNIVAMNNLIAGNKDLAPELGESVGPGGIMGIYGFKDEYTIEVVFGKPRESDIGIS